MTIDVLLASGTFTPPPGVVLVDVLLVAGGGAGGSVTSGTGPGGGGGGGGVRWLTAVPVTPGVPVNVIVGAGGAAAAGDGLSGGDTSFAAPGGTLTALGGGGGSRYNGGAIPGVAGGSGGGGSARSSSTANAGGAGTAGQGNAGGAGNVSTNASSRSAGGGGGAGAAGTAASTGTGGPGGVGVDMSANVGAIGGAAGWFGGGGGGATGGTSACLGGQGGGGRGDGLNASLAGTANTGGGGGGENGTAGATGKAGGSGLVAVVYTVPPPGVPGSYRARVTVGSHVYDVTSDDPPDYGVTLPLSWGWAIPESVDFFPTQANPITGSFGLVVPTVAEVDDLAIGDPVTIEVYTPSTALTPWQATRGVVTQLDATVGDRNRVTVYFSDPSVLLANKVVGLVDWPIENVFDRLDRVCTEAGIVFDYTANSASGGLLPARSAGATDALSAIRSALKDDADRNTSYAGTTIYGRTVYAYDPDLATLFVVVSDRSVTSWPALLDADGTLVANPAAVFGGGLDGCAVQTDGSWARLSGDRYSYVILDGVVIAADGTIGGAVSGVPYVRNTGFVDGPGPVFPSADARAYLGRSLLPIPDEGAPGWRTDTIRHLAYLDPDPVEHWLGEPATAAPYDLMPWLGIHHVIVSPVDPTLTLDGSTIISGTLTAARFTLPPGGKFYLDVTLRPTLFPTDPIRTPTGAARWQDVDPALAWADLDPALTWRDLSLAAQP